MHKEAIIIGAGISGIKTAIDLYDAGIKNTLIFEARDRLGGRLCSVKSPGQKVTYDFGALWFHDALKNPLFDKALALGNVDYYFDDGKFVYFSEKDKKIEYWTFMPTLSELITYTQLVYAEEPNKPDVSLKEICEQYLREKKNLLTLEQLEYTAPALRMWAEMWHGVTWENLSAKVTFEDGGNHLGRNVFVKSGYFGVFENELNELPQKYREDNIKLNSQVCSIDYSDPKIVQVTLKDGLVYTCDYLVVTIPLSLLLITDKKDPCCISWSPSLPKNLSNAFVKFGSLGKVVLEFNECFWPKDIDRFYALTDRAPIDHKNPQPWEHPALFVNYEPMCNFPSLVVLVQDSVIKYIENLEENEKALKVWELFKPMVAQFSDVAHPPEPTNILHTAWSNDVFSRGAYSAAFVGSDDDAAFKALGEGLGRIRFAGAETIDGSANGCAHGAWFSGQREAKHIVKHIGKRKLNSKL